MIMLIIGGCLLLCLIAYFIWINREYRSYSGITWLFIVVIIPIVLFVAGSFLTVAGILKLIGIGIGGI